ncbi:MAG: CHASE2 domain-containing protein [Phycisphaerales bacterium]
MEETRAAQPPSLASPPSGGGNPVAQVKNRAEKMARVQWGIGMLVTLVVMALWPTGLLRRLEFPFVDEYMRRFFSAAPPPANDLCLVIIDDDSLDNTKRWPWPRDMQARVIDELRLAGAKVIALDLLLNTPEPGPRFEPWLDVAQPRSATPVQPLHSLGGGANNKEGVFRGILPDRAYADAIARHGMVVLGAEFPFITASTEDKAEAGTPARKRARFPEVFAALKANPALDFEQLKRMLLDPSDWSVNEGARIDDLRRDSAAVRTLLKRRETLSAPMQGDPESWLATRAPDLPAEGLFEAGAVIGSVTANGTADDDGIGRRMPLWVRHDDRLYPTLGLAASAAFLGVPLNLLRIEPRHTVIPTSRGDIRLEMHRADLSGHPKTEGLFYLAWPTGTGSHRQFSPGKHADSSEPAAATKGPSAGSVANECGDDRRLPPAGDELGIGAVYEAALVEARIKKNIEDTDRSLIEIQQDSGIGVGLIEEPVPAYAARSNALIRTPMDDPGWRPVLDEHMKRLSANRQAAAGYVEALRATPNLSEEEKQVLRVCEMFVSVSNAVEREVNCGLQGIARHRDMLRTRVSGKLCLVGWNAVGAAADFVPTSIDVKTPGPYLHAAIINSILTGHQKIVSAPAVTFTGLASILIMGVLGTLVGVRLGVIVSPLGLLGIGAVWAVGAGIIIFDRWNSVSAFASPLLAGGVSWLTVLLHRLLVEQRGRKQTEARFRSYVSPDVVDILVNNPDLQSMAPQRRELTIMFSDVANWTTLTERLGTEGIFKFLSTYLGEMTDIIQKNKATLDKYLGDGIMAFWGAPVVDPDHAKNAAKACVDMLERLDEMNRTGGFGNAGAIEIRFGIATGEVNVGDFGNPPHKSAYTVIGDAVNLAARLESSNKQFGTSILMTKRVVDLSGSTMLFRPIGRIVVKGKTDYEELYELIGDRKPKGDRTAEWIRATNDAVAAYQSGRLDDAERLFSTLHDDFGDTKLAKLYLHGIEDLRKTGIPEAWEGTLVLTEK